MVLFAIWHSFILFQAWSNCWCLEIYDIYEEGYISIYIHEDLAVPGY